MVYFKATIRRGGNAYVVTVPKAFIENQILDLDTEYIFSVEEE